MSDYNDPLHDERAEARSLRRWPAPTRYGVYAHPIDCRCRECNWDEADRD